MNHMGAFGGKSIKSIFTLIISNGYKKFLRISTVRMLRKTLVWIISMPIIPILFCILSLFDFDCFLFIFDKATGKAVGFQFADYTLGDRAVVKRLSYIPYSVLLSTGSEVKREISSTSTKGRDALARRIESYKRIHGSSTIYVRTSVYTTYRNASEA